MQRSKQQALMFLLGAVLVGGVLGFSADRVLTRDKPRDWTPRVRMYEDLGLTQEQRSRMDSLLDDRSCQISAVMKPVRAQVDSIRESAHQQILQMLTPEQREKFELRRQEWARRDSVRESKRRQSSPTKTLVCN
jgi:Spy/CpxP family protein refolding chaperone